MLVEESIWIAEKIKEILPEEPFPVLNIGSSTLIYRTKKQPFIQNNIFNLSRKWLSYYYQFFGVSTVSRSRRSLLQNNP